MAVVIEHGSARVVRRDEVEEERIYVHDETNPDPGPAFALSRLSHGPHGPTPLGVFRAAERATYEDMMQRQLVQAQYKQGPGDLAELITSGGTWRVPR